MCADCSSALQKSTSNDLVVAAFADSYHENLQRMVDKKSKISVSEQLALNELSAAKAEGDAAYYDRAWKLYIMTENMKEIKLNESPKKHSDLANEIVSEVNTY